ncbi:TetR/AcrR family transcriptional regulator [Nocardia sp. NPDC059240]|uniref:TetR/AcrR family transcriptional regulator n=1 Tax=Nocardia sp. NPDC059240 TaxID=3346786 RepID=UPI0036B568D0
MSNRLSRPESQARTRARLVASATELYLRDGFTATSNNQVAEAAGYSRGAVYSNFASKEELALSVLDKHTTEEFAELVRILTAGSAQDRIDAFQAWAMAASGDPRWAWFKTELALVSRRSPSLRAQLAARDEQARSEITALVEQVGADLGLAVPAQPSVVAGLLMALGKGIAIDSLIDSAGPPTWLRELFDLLNPLLAMLSENPSD